jgi:hypothetical protein
MLDRNPKPGPTPSKSHTSQPYPGTDAELRPEADHGEESYRGSGRLEGLAAVVTGGDSGIGRAVAIAFAKEGADVAIGYLDDAEEEDAEYTRRHVEAAGRRCLVRRFDVRDRAACFALVRKYESTKVRKGVQRGGARAAPPPGLARLAHPPPKLLGEG